MTFAGCTAKKKLETAPISQDTKLFLTLRFLASAVQVYVWLSALITLEYAPYSLSANYTNANRNFKRTRAQAATLKGSNCQPLFWRKSGEHWHCLTAYFSSIAQPNAPRFWDRGQLISQWIAPTLELSLSLWVMLSSLLMMTCDL